MQMRVDKLRETLKVLQPVIPKKTTLPVTKNILLRDGKAVATDLEATVILELPEAKGECLVPYHQVSELLKYVPGDEQLTLETKNGSLRLSWKNGQAAYDVAKPDEYPAVPEVKVKAEAEVDGGVLVKGLTDVVGFCATEESRPVLTGVALYLGENTAVAAGDGFRMGYQLLPLPFPSENTVIVPASAVNILDYLWGKVPVTAQLAASLVQQVTAKRKIGLALGEGNMALRFGRATFITRLIDGNPPTFKDLIPTPRLKVQVLAPELEQAVRRLEKIANEASGIVRLKWTEKEMTLSAQSAEVGEVEATIPANAEDGPGRIAVNVHYLVEYLRGKENLVTIGITSDSSPILFKYGTSPIVVVMPMMVQW
jgi:DNA polymerase-3 subunit beta